MKNRNCKEAAKFFHFFTDDINVSVENSRASINVQYSCYI